MNDQRYQLLQDLSETATRFAVQLTNARVILSDPTGIARTENILQQTKSKVRFHLKM